MPKLNALLNSLSGTSTFMCFIGVALEGGLKGGMGFFWLDTFRNVASTGWFLPTAYP